MNDDLNEIYLSAGKEAYDEAVAQNDAEEKVNEGIQDAGYDVYDDLSDFFYDINRGDKKAATDDANKVDDAIPNNVDEDDIESNEVKLHDRVDDLMDRVLDEDSFKDFKHDILALNRLNNWFDDHDDDPSAYMDYLLNC